MWYSIINSRCSSSGEVYAEIEIGINSPWFSGHFPDEPILPGIAQLSMVMETIKMAFRDQIRITALKRVRFKKIVRPESRLMILVTPGIKKDESVYFFQIKSENNVICSGMMTAEKRTTAQ